MDAQFWDERYGSRERLFSGRPNGVLVREAAGLAPGQALDVGCGEGADAVWLAERGWRVTAVDLSRVALERAARAGAHLAERIAWSHGDLRTTPPPAGAFDLVSAQYFPIERDDDEAARSLIGAVAPGGTLLFVGHAPSDRAREHGVDFDAYCSTADIARLLGPGWEVLVHQTRERTAPPPEGAHHTHDTVLRAVRSVSGP